MKMKFYFSIVIMALVITNASAQKRVVENAIKVATLVPPSNGGAGCKINTRPCAILNKDHGRTITVRIEESFVVNNSLSKKVIVMDKLAPGEKRYVGCAGSVTEGQNKESTGYKILLAYYDDPAPSNPQPAPFDKQADAITSSK